MRRIVLMLPLAWLALASLGCPSSPPPPMPPPAPVPHQPQPGPKPAADGEDAAPSGDYAPATDEALEALVAANNTFASELYARVRREPGNLALSPASIAVALGMTYAGAEGETATQMKRTLHLTSDASASHNGFGTLLRSWQAEPKMPYELSVANRLFSDERFEVKAPFASVTREYYQAPIERVDFAGAPEAARKRINAWVGDETEEKIDTLLPEGSVDPSTRLVLTNAIYFKGTWASTFSEKATRPAAFHGAEGDTKVPTMHQTAFFRYAEIDGAKVLEMPYRGGRFAMSLLLPNERDGLAALEQRMTHEALSGWLEALERWKVRVALPRFTIDPAQPLALSTALAALGMPALFNPRAANLRGIADPASDENLFVSDVFHKAFVEVNEKGTEAAAATGVAVSVTSAPLPSKPPKEFLADHPFVFFIRDLENGSLLFMGRVSRPR